jgi:tRNA(Arg) A34 adenosine deaminase TadA
MGDSDSLAEAVRLTVQNVKEGGRPFASVIVSAGQIVARGVNLSAQSRDPTAHAEMLAIRADRRRRRVQPPPLSEQRQRLAEEGRSSDAGKIGRTEEARLGAAGSP